MTTSEHIQSIALAHDRASKRRERLQDLALAALTIALLLATAFVTSWLLPLEFAAPRPS